MLTRRRALIAVAGIMALAAITFAAGVTLYPRSARQVQEQLRQAEAAAEQAEATALQAQVQERQWQGDRDELRAMRALRQTLEQLPKGKIYLDAPREMKVDDNRTVDARVGVNVPDEVLRGHIRAGDQQTEGNLRVSYEMIATLSGPGFAITQTTPEKQKVAEGFPTVWEWNVEAKQAGTQELEATLYALLSDSASGKARQRIDSYTQTISVAVKPRTWAEWLHSVSEEIGAIKAILLSLGTLTMVVLGWFGISRKRQRNRKLVTGISMASARGSSDDRGNTLSDPRRAVGGEKRKGRRDPAL